MQALIAQLTSQLGVSEEQAKGGAGLLLKEAKEKLSSEDYQQVSAAVGGAEQLESAAPAPEAGGLGALAGGLLGSFGGGAAQLGSFAKLAGGFQSLGLDTSMVAKFIPQILEFVKGKVGAGVVENLTQSLQGAQQKAGE